MARIWANVLEAGRRTWADCVKSGRAEAVKAVLREDVEAGVITAERYQEITGEPYEVA